MNFTRRRVLRLLASSSLALVISGCPKEEAASEAAITAVSIGKLIHKLPHPVAKVVGVALEILGESFLLILLLENARDNVSISLPKEEGRKVAREQKISLVRGDGTTEERPVRVVLKKSMG